MKKLFFIFLFIASGLFAQFNDGDGYFQKYQWNLLSNNVLESIYALQIGQNGGTSGSITWVASDNDQFTFVITTSDEASFEGASGGYKFRASAITYTIDDNYIHRGAGTRFGITPGTGSATNAAFRANRDYNYGLGGTTTTANIVAGDVNAVEVTTLATNVKVDLFTGTTTNGDGNPVNDYMTVKVYMDSTIAGEVTLSSVLPQGYVINNIIFKNTTANEITDFNIGFSDDGEEVVADGAVLANDEGSFTVLQRIDDFDAVDDLYISASNWNSANLIIYIKMTRMF